MHPVSTSQQHLTSDSGRRSVKINGNEVTVSSGTARGEQGDVYVERHYRSLVKTISWRITGTIDTLVLSYLITGSIKLAASISGLEVFTKIVLYYVHERVWSRLQFGRQYQPPPDYQI